MENNKINFYINEYIENTKQSKIKQIKKERKALNIKYEDMISVENLLLAWRQFKKGKSKKKDVQEFEFKLMENVLDLHYELKSKIYKHSKYEYFKVKDPKERDINKASVRDRVMHHTIYQNLYLFFDRLFIADSYSCRVGKGTHKAQNRFREFLNKESKNHTKPCYVLKCDIRKFFANIDHKILINILKSKIVDKDILNLLENIIISFESKLDNKNNIGLPLGNLTSQLLVNIYMNEFDQYIKQKLKVRYYIRYADDFVFIHQDRNYLESILKEINIFLNNNLKLQLHPNKVFIKSIYSGIDFLGFVFFPTHKVLRTSTKKRMFRKLRENDYNENSINSYLGLLRYGDCYGIKGLIRGEIKS